jgi:hypothetical protein
MAKTHLDSDESTNRRRNLKTITVENPAPLNNNNAKSAILHQSLPRVLTRSVIPTLAVTSLDAGDAVECYHLTRSALLQGTNIRITKSALGVRYRRPANEMMYYSDQEEPPSQRLELTIEFGAARAGPDLTQESMPHLVYRRDDINNSTNNNNSNNSAVDNNAIPIGVDWDNAGRVYYTERIDSETYTTANYLASLSGTVLTKLLQSALDFVTLPPSTHKHDSKRSKSSSSSSTSTNPTSATRQRVRRYQPFDVYLVSNDTVTTTGSGRGISEEQKQQQQQLIFRSSNDADFVEHVLAALAELGVAIQPVILPTSFTIQLHAATAIQKIKIVPATDSSTQPQPQQHSPPTLTTSFSAIPMDATHPTMFYQKLFSCVQAIASANYTAYNTSVAKTITNPTVPTAPATTGAAGNNASATTAAPVSSTRAPVSMIVRPPRALTKDAQKSPSISHRQLQQVAAVTGTGTAAPVALSNGVSEQLLQSAVVSATKPPQTSAAAAALVVNATIPPTRAPIAKKARITTAPTLLPIVSLPTTMAPFPNTTGTLAPLPEEPDSMATHQEQATAAAEQAQHAANAADAAGTEDEAVSAAKEAAVYAHKAATVTAQQAASMARDAILSGVGSSVAQAVALCFSDPLYGLVTASSSTSLSMNGTNTTEASNSTSALSKRSMTTAYIYWDGIYYYQVNLTAPYVTVASSVRTMPQPPVMGIGAEDFVDWAIALLLLACASIGFLLLLQQVMGRNLKVIRPLYRYQRWFFAPTHFAWKDVVNDDSESVSTRGLGQQYTFGEDVIPLSMGGRRPRWFNGGGGSRDGLQSFDDDDDLDDDDLNDVFVTDHNMQSTRGDMILGDLELTETSMGRPRTPTVNSSYKRGLSGLSDVSGGGIVEDELDRIIPQAPPIRLYRDPNLVDLPDCTFWQPAHTLVMMTFMTHDAKTLLVFPFMCSDKSQQGGDTS